MAETKGTLSINSDNIFPIIKKWLYSDHDIFFRELISNGCDAITKLKKLDMMGDHRTFWSWFLFCIYGSGRSYD
jgi:molecular chaperone HtpG